VDQANIFTSSRYLKPSKLALHTTIQRIDGTAARERRSSKMAAGSGCGRIYRGRHKKGHTLIELLVSVRSEKP
jgi:hypothetical protein